MKYSLIVPVYNVEDYIIQCLQSIYNQSYPNYEVIIVNDGTEDNSQLIIDDFIKDKPNFKSYIKDNGGLSDARNYGLQYVTGDYILFIDSDDYINKDLLLNINEELTKNRVDVIKYGMTFVEDNNSRIMNKTNFSNISVDAALKFLLNDELLEPAWLYAYKTSFWQEHHFKYAKNRIHEDFGLTPLILMNASSISSISYVGYNYVIRSNSIMTSNDDAKKLKKFNDCLYFYENNIPLIDKCPNINEYSKKLLKSFYANGIVNRVKTLSVKDYNNMLKLIKNNKVLDNLIDDTLKRKVKKFLLKRFSKVFIRRNI